MIIRIKKIGSVENPVHEDSTHGSSQPFFEGTTLKIPEVGKSFGLLTSDKNLRNIITTTVVEVSQDTFKTLNSIYSWEIILE